MKILHLTPGTGHFYCGSCLRDQDLCRQLQELGHEVLMVPLYLPFVLQEGDSLGKDAPVFLGGVNMYLQQKAAWSKKLPGWLRRLFDAPRFLRFVSRFGDMTDAPLLGELTLSTLRGEEGNQAQELERLVKWLQGEPKMDVVCLSNIMLVGAARRLRQALGTPIVCSMQGELPFLDSLPSAYREAAWQTVRERAQDVDAFLAVSHHYGEQLRQRLDLPKEKVHVVHNGIATEDWSEPRDQQGPPVLGFLARLCEEKGLPELVDAFVRLKQSGRVPDLRLRAVGVTLKMDLPLLESLRRQLRKAGFEDSAEFHSNVDKSEKIRLVKTFTVLSVPANYEESFGLYLLEAMASGIPVVQPRHAAFPEILEATGGGVLCEPRDPADLADKLEGLFLDPERREHLGRTGQRAVEQGFTARHMASGFADVCKMVIAN